jgi:hypothetical protein
MIRKLKWILLFVLVFATALVGFIMPPRFILEIGLPEYAKDLPTNFKNASEVFNTRIQEALGQIEHGEVLLDRLRDDGFSVNVESMSAQITRSKLPCTLKWTVYWRATEQNSIKEVKGHYGGVCL